MTKPKRKPAPKPKRKRAPRKHCKSCTCHAEPKGHGMVDGPHAGVGATMGLTI